MKNKLLITIVTFNVIILGLFIFYNCTPPSTQTKTSGGSGADVGGGNYTEWTNPVGAILAYGGTTAPEGWLLCDGNTVSRAIYGNLHGVILYAFGGSGDNFNLPDLRGQFLRGYSGDRNDGKEDPDASSREGGNSIGSWQEDELKSHNHGYTRATSGKKVDSGGLSGFYRHPTSVFTEYTGGNETRPKNIAVNFIIKY